MGDAETTSAKFLEGLKQVATTTPADALQKLLDVIVQLSNSTCGYIGRVDDDGRIVIVAATGMTDVRRNQDRFVGKGFIGNCINWQRPIWASNKEGRRQSGAEDDLYESEFAIPLFAGHQVYGALDLHSLERDTYKDEKLRDLIQMSVIQVGWMGHVTEVLVDRNRDLAALASFSDTLRKVAETTPLIESALLVAKKWTGAQYVWVGFFEPLQNTIIPRYALGFDVSSLGPSLPREIPAFGEYYLRLEQAAPAKRRGDEASYWGYPTRIKEEMIFPLIWNKESIGILSLATDRVFRQWRFGHESSTEETLPYQDLLESSPFLVESLHGS